MERKKYEEFREKALKDLKLADHIFTMTYPLVNDPKLLKVVIKNIYNAMKNTIAMLLNYERYYKRIPPFSENYEAMVELCKEIFSKYKISQNYISFLYQIKEKMELQKKSEVEFVRKEKVVFASKDYDLNTLSVYEIKEYLAKAKLFMKEIMDIIK